MLTGKKIEDAAFVTTIEPLSDCLAIRLPDVQDLATIPNVGIKASAVVQHRIPTISGSTPFYPDQHVGTLNEVVTTRAEVKKLTGCGVDEQSNFPSGLTPQGSGCGAAAQAFPPAESIQAPHPLQPIVRPAAGSAQ
jgi:hypothetical protein